MPLYDNFYFDQKWSVWDTWRAFGRTLRAYVITTSFRLGRVISASNRRGNVVATSKRRGNIITGD